MSSPSDIIAWRLVSERWADSALDGTGAKLAGGRWNSKGLAATYLSSSLALAAMELLVHLEIEEVLADYRCIRVTLPSDSMEILPPSQLPDTWMEQPSSPACRAVGDQWLRSGLQPVLRVPSVIVPYEVNYLLNPEHEAAVTIIETSSEPLPFQYDPRLAS